LPEHQSVDDCRRSLLLPRLKQLVTLRREGYIRIYLLLDGLAQVWKKGSPHQMRLAYQFQGQMVKGQHHQAH